MCHKRGQYEYSTHWVKKILPNIILFRNYLTTKNIKALTRGEDIKPRGSSSDKNKPRRKVNPVFGKTKYQIQFDYYGWAGSKYYSSIFDNNNSTTVTVRGFETA